LYIVKDIKFLKRYDKMEEVNKSKAEFYFNSQSSIHITLTTDRFYNGIIKEILDDKLILDDEKLGETVVMFVEIERLEPREVKK